MKFLKILIVISSIIIFSDCSNSKGFEEGSDMIIEYEGKYQLKGECELCIKVTNGFVTYNMLDSRDSIILSNAESISTYQKWYFYYESFSQNLWIWSSDLGLILWKKNIDGKYTQRYVNNEDGMDQFIPPLLFKKMPSSVK